MRNVQLQSQKFVDEKRILEQNFDLFQLRQMRQRAREFSDKVVGQIGNFEVEKEAERVWNKIQVVVADVEFCQMGYLER